MNRTRREDFDAEEDRDWDAEAEREELEEVEEGDDPFFDDDGEAAEEIVRPVCPECGRDPDAHQPVPFPILPMNPATATGHSRPRPRW